MNYAMPWTTIVSAWGSMHWVKDGNKQCVKAKLTLEGVGNSFRIVYDGHHAAFLNMSVHGSLLLPPPTEWTVTATKVRSEHATARVLLHAFENEDNWVQITLPITGNGSVQRNFVRAFVTADY